MSDGLLYLLLPGNLFALLTLGLLAGPRDLRDRLAIAAALAIGLAAGALTLATAIRNPPADIALLGVAILTGLILAAAWRPPVSAVVTLALFAGAAISLNSPPQAIRLAGAAASQAATAVGAVILFAIVALIVSAARTPTHHIAVRVVGAWIAASAIMMLALRLTR